jgi:hypothetical protein
MNSIENMMYALRRVNETYARWIELQLEVLEAERTHWAMVANFNDACKDASASPDIEEWLKTVHIVLPGIQ